MPITEKYFHEEPISYVIGPQIGPSFDPCGVRITVALPHRGDTKLTCHLLSADGQKVDEQSSDVLHPIFKPFVFNFENLEVGAKYSYKFLSISDEEVDLEGDLSYQDCWFYAPTFKDNDKLVLLSCNNPFHSEKQGNDQFEMWRRLQDVVTKDPKIKLIVQGGDQVYHDDIEADCLQKLKATIADEEGVRNNIIKNYQHYYGDLNYRKIMANIPSVAMLDDHDITDGWGGRPESFNDKDIKPEWQNYFDIAYDAFKAYQSVKNPEIRLYEGVETTFLDFGENRIYLLDLRKEKNIKNKDFPLLSANHEVSFLKSLENTPDNISNILILSPVVPVRINPKMEETLGFVSDTLFQLRAFAKIKMRSAVKYSKAWSALHWCAGLGGIADLTDDITDGLSSSINRRFLINVLEKLAELSISKNKKTYFMSGDIHTGGMSEIFVENGETTVCIPQIVSSPIGYAPMAKIAKDKTTEEADYKIITSKPAPDTIFNNSLVIARNIFYRSDRNFVVMKLTKNRKNTEVVFHFENLSFPIISPVTFSDC